MKFCPNCGAKIAENAKFCAGCGQPLAEGQNQPIKTAEDNIHSADNDEDKPIKENNPETSTLGGLEDRMLAIDKFLRTRKDYGKMKQRYHPLCGILALVLSFLCIGIIFFGVCWILFGLCDLDASNWNGIVIILVILGIIYAFYKMLKWLFDIFVHHLSCFFCRSFINKYADEICVHCRVSMRDIDHFSHDYDCLQNLLAADTSSIKLKPKQESDK